MNERIKNAALRSKIMTAEDAAKIVEKGMVIGFSGFTMSGYPKLVPQAIAARGEGGEKLGLTVITGASVGDPIDGAMVRAGVVARRYPYQSSKDMRNAINAGNIKYADVHLSQSSQWIRNGIYGNIDLAIVEASSIDEEGNIIPTTSVGSADAMVLKADKVIVELNTAQPEALNGLHDIHTPRQVPYTEPIPVLRAGDRIGTTYIPCTPDKIAAIVYSDIPDAGSTMTEADDVTKNIAANLIAFLQDEMKAGRLCNPLPPLQSGVGGVGNAVLSALASSGMSGLQLYSEVLQSSVLDLLDNGVVDFASGCALSLSREYQQRFYENVEEYKRKLVLRPQEISNSPEVIRRLGVIAINTAIEADLSGNVNSTHINGDRLMNGIGGSGDYARNAGVTIFVTPSTAKGGALSSIVPVVAHVDHTEHDVDVIITEHGAADLRGLCAYERAELLIENCADDAFKPMLRAYMERVKNERSYHHGIPSL